MIDKVELWVVIIALGLGSFAMRFVFTGLVGDRPLPDWVLRHLRYTAVAILPALVAPLVIWPNATNGEPDPARLLAAGVTIVVGLLTRHVFLSILCGALALAAGLNYL